MAAMPPQSPVTLVVTLNNFIRWIYGSYNFIDLVLQMQRCKWILYLLISFLFVVSCNRSQPKFLIYTPKEDIKIEVDSVMRWPALAAFPIRVRITNYTNNKVALFFDTISNVYKDQVKNLYITEGTDTFNLGIRISGVPLILNERTVASVNCIGYIRYGKGHFDSFIDIEYGFKEGKLVYRMGKKPITKSQLEEFNIEADTILLPTLLEVKTDKALFVNDFL